MGLNIDQQLRTAKAQIKAGHADEARVTLLQALDVYPDNARLLTGLAEAQKLLTGLPTYGFGPPHMQHFLSVKARFGLGLAVEEIAAAVKLNPKHPWPKGILGGALLEAGMLPAAIIQLRRALKLDPKFKEASLNLANALGLAGETEQSLAVLDAALGHHPDFAAALRMKGHALMHLKQGEAAAEVLDRYLAVKPGDVEAKIDLGVGLGYCDSERAAAVLAEVLAAHPDNLRAMSNLGNAYLALGNLPKAIELLEETLRRNPKSTISFFNLCRARDFVAGDPLIAQMQALEGDAALGDEEQTALHFGLAKALEDIGDVDESFRHLKAGNDRIQAASNYDLSKDAAVLDDQRKRFAAGAGVALPADPNLRRRPIFVLGMMRSGTTLMEQILSSHPLVTGAGELSVLPRLAQTEVLKSSGPLDEAALRRVRGGYLEVIDAQPGDEPYVIDKLPANFRLIGLIRKALPEAIILHMRRDPVAVCWSIYKNHFTQTGNGYANSLQDTMGFYDLYEGVMAEWRADYPGEFLDVDYEALTRDPGTNIRAVLDYCGLPFDPACLAPQDNKREIRTASVRQVRSGIYQGSSDKWRGFAPYLAPLIEHFGKTKA